MKGILLFFIILVGLLPAQGQNNKYFKGIDKELNEVLKTWNAVGFAVAVVEKDKIIYSKGFGYRDYENKKPVTPNTLFPIGSCSKAFTASLLGVLENEGKLSLDDRPGKHISELRFYSDELNNFVIIKDLMSHQTGLPRHDMAWYLFPSYSKDSLIHRIPFLEPVSGLREKWFYNNFMFLLQGVIAERKTGTSWEQNIADVFFGPLKMSRSNLSINELKAEGDRALGYTLTKDGDIKKEDYYDIAGMGPAGSINSSVNEMSHWLIAWINRGEFQGQQIIPSTYVEEAISSQAVGGAGLPGEEYKDIYFANYGYGWKLTSYKGHYRVSHGGAIDGFAANTCFFPSDSVGIVVLSNQRGSFLPIVVRNIIADRILGTSSTDWNKKLKDRFDEVTQKQRKEIFDDSDRKSNTKPTHLLSDYTGSYTHPGYGKFEVVKKKDSLFVDFPKDRYWLKHYHYDIFKLYKVENSVVDTTQPAQFRFNFRTSNIGDISSVAIKFEPMIDPLEFVRQPKEIDVGIETLKRYIGEYDLSGTITKVYFENEKDLRLHVPGQPEYKLIAIGLHEFSIEGLSGYKVQFKEGEKGTITEVSFIQPDGTFNASKK